ncbi:hypothetical protein EVAR_27610_1 [Eumeta japonica]|uniref:Uncharacterized protein n=1 Tax=Eumeta variegata TaxID=151549 RepID=A0A4C1V1M8_EUMVA|nr:hypothetical protein EVAR_27610_1 [Eumeta japonica]
MTPTKLNMIHGGPAYCYNSEGGYEKTFTRGGKFNLRSSEVSPRAGFGVGNSEKVRARTVKIKIQTLREPSNQKDKLPDTDPRGILFRSNSSRV